MTQVRRFEFPGKTTMFGVAREEAAELLEEAERMLEGVLSVSSVSFTRSRDTKLLGKLGIKAEGVPADGRTWEKSAPSEINLEEHLATWREEKTVRGREARSRFYEDRRREDAAVREQRRRIKSGYGATQPFVLKRLGGEIRHAREELGITQTTLASRTDLSAHWIPRVERGLVNPTLGDLVLLSHGLNVGLSVLVHAADTAKEEPSRQRAGERGKQA